MVLLPEPEDPDSFAQSHTPTELQQYIDEHEEDFIRFKTRILLKDSQNDPLKRSEVVGSIVVSISKINNAVTRSFYIKECSKLLDVKEDALYAETGRLIKKQHEDLIKAKFRQSTDIVNPAEPNAAPPRDGQQIMPNNAETQQVPTFVQNVYAEVEEREMP